MLLGLTGGIGSGKSTVLEIFQELSVIVEDADLIVHNLYKNDEELKQEIVKRWGKDACINNRIDRKFIAKIVFANHIEIQWLNALIHPKVREKISEIKHQSKIVIVAIPLLYEGQLEERFSKIISVWCPEETQLQRLLKRGWSKEEIDDRKRNQMHQDEKLHRADYGIINDGTIENLKSQCEKILINLKLINR